MTDYRFLGRTGLKIAALGMGCMTFEHGMDESLAHAMLDRYVEAGGNYFDVADNYGVAEEVLGRWLKSRGRRAQWIVASKVRFPAGDGGPNDVGLTRKHIIDGVENSLRKLQTDFIDLYQAHCWDFVTPIDETLRVFDDLITSGKVRYIGASNFTGWQITKANAASETNGWARFENLQTQYSLLCRSPEWEIIPACRDIGMSLTAWSPLAAGWLSGKYRRDQVPPTGSRLADAAQTLEEWQSLQQVGVNATIPHPRKLQQQEIFEKKVSEVEAEKRWRILDAVADVAASHGKTPAQVALAWILANPSGIIPIIGATRLEQLEDNIGAIGWSLTPEEYIWLNKVSDPGTPYPLDFFQQFGIPWR